jgi:hypothetical protein
MMRIITKMKAYNENAYDIADANQLIIIIFKYKSHRLFIISIIILFY